ncbi:ABC transporter permease [Paramuribaculum intestinale]|uniref:ABC transporter permease n=1 Tax=Paramuribaculum intestinale TaxID=2094151 RepID=UPI0025B6CA11|nr:FtsX-like permease family protein [Paramuribaculum intestinale]
MRIELELARRLSLRQRAAAGRRRSRLAPGVVIAIAGTALSLLVMVLAVSIATGFKTEIRQKVTGFEQQITVSQAEGYGAERVNRGIRLTDSLRTIIADAAPGSHASLRIHQPAMIKTDTDFEGIVLQGITDGSDTYRFIARQTAEGDTMPHFAYGHEGNPIVISRTTASALGLATGETVAVHFFIGGNLLTRKMRVAAVYDTHFGEYDKLMAFCPIDILQRLNHTDSLTGTSIDINGLDTDMIDEATASLRAGLFEHLQTTGSTESYRIDNVNTTGAIYFNWLELLDTNIVVILSLMGCVTGFTLISSLLIIILQRVRTIGLLKALGAADSQIRRVFVMMACRIVAAGLIAGNLVAVAIIVLQNRLHIIPLNPEAYYLNYVPMAECFGTIALIDVAVAIVSVALLLIPSHLISRISPAETMRYE